MPHISAPPRKRTQGVQGPFHHGGRVKWLCEARPGSQESRARSRSGALSSAARAPATARWSRGARRGPPACRFHPRVAHGGHRAGHPAGHGSPTTLGEALAGRPRPGPGRPGAEGHTAGHVLPGSGQERRSPPGPQPATAPARAWPCRGPHRPAATRDSRRNRVQARQEIRPVLHGSHASDLGHQRRVRRHAPRRRAPGARVAQGPERSARVDTVGRRASGARGGSPPAPGGPPRARGGAGPPARPPRGTGPRPGGRPPPAPGC
jgi:hypothetical protein